MRFGDPSRGGRDRASGAETRNPAFCGGEAKDAAAAVPEYLRDKVALKTSER